MSARAMFKSKIPNHKPAAALPLRDLAELQRDALLKVTGKGKYGSKRCTVEGEAFDSKAEARRWLELRDMQRRGVITGLIRQPRFPLEVNGIHLADYFADFQYYTAKGVKITEDVKAKSGVTCTQVYRLKKRLVYAIHGITIREHFV